MKKHILTICLVAVATIALAQQKTEIRTFRLTGPYAVTVPMRTDSVDNKGNKFDEKALMQAVPLSAKSNGEFSGQLLPSLPDQQSVGVLTFYLNNTSYVKGKLKVTGPKNYELYIDEEKVTGGDLALQPEHHTVALRYLAQPSDTDSISVVVDANLTVKPTTDSRHPYMLHDQTDNFYVRNASLSADGRFLMSIYQLTNRKGKSQWKRRLHDLQAGKLLWEQAYDDEMTWMNRSVAYIQHATENGRRILYKVNPLTGQRSMLAQDVPEGSITMSPTEDYLILSEDDEGPKHDGDVFELVNPEDRQPGWRNRNHLYHYDLATGVTRRITFGSQAAYLSDISSDGQRLLVSSYRTRLEKRPTTVVDVFIVDARTLKTDTVMLGAEFVDDMEFSPDGRQLLFKGSPEAFGRIGCQLSAEKTPSMLDYQLFLYDLSSRHVTPLTRDFNPSVESFMWADVDGMIYFRAEDLDYVRLFQLNPQTGKIVALPMRGDNTTLFSMASQSSRMAYLSQETAAPASLYVMDLKKKDNTRCVYDGHEALSDVLLGECRDWNFKNSKGDTVYGRLYLPHDFDSQKRYPMIVYYYGGCSPVSRGFSSPYSPHLWNSLGYVAYIMQPSGCTGFGQEWSARHVNTWGEGPAEDIIEGTKQICREHPFIDATKVGCMGASYGGFMTQYLQTRTDIFAAAVSHAGISNVASYWGLGYWGYTYSEVASADSYPWNNPTLYTRQSPLFNADKIHTPLLFLHGTADTNVPPIESIQMFTALKLLGRPTAFVEVEGENHHIKEYAKRHRWVATQMAWFQRYLKGDATWWDALYPATHL